MSHAESLLLPRTAMAQLKRMQVPSSLVHQKALFHSWRISPTKALLQTVSQPVSKTARRHVGVPGRGGTSASQVRRSAPCAAMHVPSAGASKTSRCRRQAQAACSAASRGTSLSPQGRTAKGTRSRCASTWTRWPLCEMQSAHVAGERIGAQIHLHNYHACTRQGSPHASGCNGRGAVSARIHTAQTDQQKCPLIVRMQCTTAAVQEPPLVQHRSGRNLEFDLQI